MDDPVITVKRLIAALALLPIAPLLIAFLGQLLRRSRPRFGGFLAVTGLLVALVTSTPIVSQALIGWVEAAGPPALTAERIRAVMTGPSPPTAIVILGGGTRFDAREHPDQTSLKSGTLERVMAGARLARATGLPVLVSGGQGPESREPEAATMARTLARDLGIKARWIEPRSLDTSGNARESARMLSEAGVRRVFLVTQAYHMPRALFAFGGAGLKVVAAPHGFLGGAGRHATFWQWVPAPSAMYASWLASHEAAGLAWYRLVRMVRGSHKTAQE